MVFQGLGWSLYSFDAALDNELGTLVTRKESHVDGASLYAFGVLVEDGIHLCKADHTF